MMQTSEPTPTQDEADALMLQVHGVTVALPAVVDTPAVTGTGAVGETLTCTVGNWTGEPTNYAYQWHRNGTAGLMGSDTYVVVEADVGHGIACSVTATNAAGSTIAPLSNAVAIVAAGGTAARAERAHPAPDPQPPRHR
jgi:hypothetical protein